MYAVVLLSLDKQEGEFSLSMTHWLVSCCAAFHRFECAQAVGRGGEKGRHFL